MTKRIVLILLLFAAVGAGVWVGLRLSRPRWQAQRSQEPNALPAESSTDTWDQAVEKVKADRGEPAGVNAHVETPPELKHYEERHWFLATQVAEVTKSNLHACQDYMDLAAMIQRGEMVTVPAFTDTYILFGIGQRADDDPFSRYVDDRSIEIYDESQLNAAYKQLDEKRAKLQSDIASLKSQATKVTKRERTKQRDLQKQITAVQAELMDSIDKEKAELDEIYGTAEARQRMFHDYESLQALAKNFAGRSFELNNSNDRQAFKMSMLSSLRPPALKVMEEVASAYHAQFGRRLPVSSLVRPEQYQRALRRVNRNAVLIDTPPHSTGLAFDIDFRYMSAAEQSFVMDKLAELKRNGRIEVIRERNANYHVFAFMNGTRPTDDLITASLEEARGPQQQTHHAPAKATPARSKKATSKARSKTATKKSTKSARGRATTRHGRRRR